ncbi:MAG: redoxin domain-containing protein [Pedosphaera sp.]|nr:redoxin domain-containing protein [Pedosphaera sp.]
MKKLLSVFLSLAALCGLVANANAKAVVGDPAAKLDISGWIKGKPVDLAAVKGKQVVVVEFWATWCGPCRTSIPHLTEMQKKFKDVIFIGVSDEDAETVKPFVKKMGDKMDYTVAVDNDRKTSAGYMEAYGINGIPHAFIVDKEGRVVWLGHPMGGLEETLAEVVAGKFDLEKSKKRGDAQKQIEAFAEAAGRDVNDPKLEKMGKDLEALDAELGGITPGEKFSAAEILKKVKFQSVMRDYQLAVMSGKGGTNFEHIEKKLAEAAPKDFDLVAFKESITTGKVINDYMSAAQKGDTNTLPELTKQVAGLKPKNPRMLLQIAWTIMDENRLKVHDYELAAKLAKNAVEAAAGKDPDSLFVYARALFEGGQTADAVSWQKKAVEAAGDNADAKKELEATLQKYQDKLAKK